MSSCSALPSGIPYAPDLAVERRSNPLGRMQPLGDLAYVLRRDVEFSGDSTEKPVISGCLGELRRDRFKVDGQVEPLDYASKHIPGRIFTSRENQMPKTKEELPPLPRAIRRLQVSLKLNQEAFAERLGVDQGTISKWVNGRAKPTPDSLVELASLADGVEKLFFLQEAGLPEEFLAGSPMIPEIRKATAQVVSRALGGTSTRQIFWDRDLLKFVIQTVNHELKKRERQLPDRKYATLVALFYELCQQTGRRDSEMMEELLKRAS